MTVEHIVNQALFNKIKSGEVTEINLPLADAYAEKFFQFKDPEDEESEIEAKKITEIVFKTNTESVAKRVSGIFVDKFVKFIPIGFKKNEVGITVEFFV